MVKDLLPAQVDANSASADFWRRYHAFRRDRHFETRRDDPILPDAVEETKLRGERTFEIVYRYEIARDGELLSWLECHTMRPGGPGYESNKHLFSAWCAVLSEHRRQGIGRSWLPLVLELMDRHGCTVLSTSADEESGHAFLKWLGAEARMSDAESRLQLADVDWAMVDRWIAEGEARSPQTRLEIYEGPLPEELLEDYSAQLSILLNTIPFEQLDHGQSVVTAAQVREWDQRMAAVQEVPHTVIAREADGSISGMTDTAWCAHTPTVVDQRFTGVRPDARGRGVGKWIKAAMARKVHELHPEARWISTWNATSNDPMLAINHALGFRRHRTGAEYQISRDDLAERVGP
jgi:GNAT superfamily N-acetyltransferase